MTIVTGVGVTLAAAFLPVGKLADYSNSGTLFAFLMVAISVWCCAGPIRAAQRPFRTPAVWVVAPLAIIGCVAALRQAAADRDRGAAVWGASAC